jgi:hypothetical protein
MRTRWLQTGVLVLLLLAIGLIFIRRQAISDWLRLVRYTPPAAVAALASDDTMTATAKNLFYVNHPDITTGKDFTSHCPAGTEKTVVLGCYVGNDGGIYIYRVTDARLNGVEQVTAAHEMLHAAYRRLSGPERAKVNAMLEDFYAHDLHDARIKSTLDAYRSSEPHDLDNEMHSIFGTEVADLPPALEAYYRHYFTNRQAVTNYTAVYQSEFSSRQAQVAAYDATLKSLKQQIDEDKASLQQQQSKLDALQAQVQADRARGDQAAYDADARAYNQQVSTYNALIRAVTDEINRYNEIVDKRNAVALEEQQLVQAISPETASPAR